MSVKIPVDEAVDRLQEDTDMTTEVPMGQRLCWVQEDHPRMSKQRVHDAIDDARLEPAVKPWLNKAHY